MRSTAGFADIVLASQAASHNTIGRAVLAICPKCHDPIVEPFNLDSHYYQSVSPLAMHERICDRVQVRKARTRVILRLLSYIEAKQLMRPAPYPHEVEEVFGSGWEVGILLGDDLGAHLTAPSWRSLADALNQEALVLTLRVGEDYVGGALVAFTTANTPTERRTNGGDSLWLFGPQNRIRAACTSLMLNVWFDRVILLCIVISSALLAFDSPRVVNRGIDVMGDVFSAIFVFEMIVKVVALGFLLHRSAYLRDSWNILDFAIVLVAILSWALGDSANIGFFKVFRTFRALRPLRVINRNKGLKMVVVTLFESIKGIVNVALITVLIWLIFAILGTQLYGGGLYWCTDRSVGSRAACRGTFLNNETFVDANGGAFVRPYLVSVPVVAPRNISNTSSTNASTPTASRVVDLRNQTRDWVTYPFNFDNTYNSFLLLFGVATLDSWSERMYQVIDSQGPELGPRRNAQPWMAIYFVLFIIIGSFFLLSLFVGVVISHYSRTKDRIDCPWPVLNDEQKHWVETQRMVLNFRPEPRRFPPVDAAVLDRARRAAANSIDLAALVESGTASTRTLWRVAAARQAVAKGHLRPLTRWEALRVATFHLVESIEFEVLTGVVVLVSIVFIALEHDSMSKDFERKIEVGNLVFVALFTIEMLLKWLGLGLRQYFTDVWSQFDFFLVAIGLFGVSVTDIPFNVNILRVMRVFRTMRLLALVRRAKRVRILLETLWFSLPALGNVSLFLLLVFFIYSVLGVQLFTFVKIGDGIDDGFSNFKTFGNSILLLVRIATMDNWSILMADVSNTKNCGPETNGDGVDDCGTPYAPLYFFTFLIIAVFVLLNILVAIILDNFNTSQKIDHSDVRLQDLKRFSDEWTKYDPDATMLMPTRHFWKLIAQLKPPLGIARRATRSALLNLLVNELWIPEHEGAIHFIEALVPLARRTHVDAKFTEDQIREHEIYWHQQVPALGDLPVQRFRQKRIGAQHYFGQQFIAAAIRRCNARLHVEEMFAQRAAELKQWYDGRGVPRDQRPALARMRKRMQERQLDQSAYRQSMMLSARGVVAAAEGGGRGDRRRSGGSGVFGAAGDDDFSAVAAAAAGARSVSSVGAVAAASSSSSASSRLGTTRLPFGSGSSALRSGATTTTTGDPAASSSSSRPTNSGDGGGRRTEKAPAPSAAAIGARGLAPAGGAPFGAFYVSSSASPPSMAGSRAKPGPGRPVDDGDYDNGNDEQDDADRDDGLRTDDDDIRSEISLNRVLGPALESPSTPALQRR